jgi:hypothetical protein
MNQRPVSVRLPGHMSDWKWVEVAVKRPISLYEILRFAAQ